jgi:hypothetical protein
VLRRYLLSQGALPNKSLTAAVRSQGSEEATPDSNNQVFGMICSIATNIEDPKERIETIIAQSTKSGDVASAAGADAAGLQPLDAGCADRGPDHGAALQPHQPVGRAAAGGERHDLQRADQRQTLYAAGAELLHISRCRSRPTAALNITVQSYRMISSISASSRAPTSFRMSRCLCDMLPLEFDVLEAARAAARRDQGRGGSRAFSNEIMPGKKRDYWR